MAAPRDPSAERSNTLRVRCVVPSRGHPDLDTIDALARLALTEWQLGRRVELLHATPALRELIDLVGLADVLPSVNRSPVESSG